MLAEFYSSLSETQAQPPTYPQSTQIYIAARTRGYAAILVNGVHRREISELASGTPQRLALLAIIHALSSCKRVQVGHIFVSDEQLVHVALGWQQPTADTEAWATLTALRTVHCVGFIYVPRESGFVWIARANEIAHGLRGVA